MTIKQLDSHIATLEGRKHQASVGDVREIRKIIAELVVRDPELLAQFLKSGLKKLKR